MSRTPRRVQILQSGGGGVGGSGGRTVAMATGRGDRGRGHDDGIRNRGVPRGYSGQAEEARGRGLNYIYNVIPAGHPDRSWMAGWLASRGFAESAHGDLRRRVGPPVDRLTSQAESPS
jgi:hypothetical protein